MAGQRTAAEGPLLRQRVRTAVRTAAAAAAVIAVVLLTAGCSAPETAGSGRQGSGEPIRIFAAASLTDVLPRLTAEYTRSHPDARFAVNMGSSAQLVRQLNAGEPAELLITADLPSLENLADPARFEEPVVLATNRLVLAVSAAHPELLAGGGPLEPFPYADTDLALCAPAVPCGRSASRYLDALGVVPGRTTEEPDVRAVLTKVVSGEAGAGFVYATDAAAAGGAVIAAELPGAEPNRYPLLTAKDASETARGFAGWLRGPEAAAVLDDAGFGRP